MVVLLLISQNHRLRSWSLSREREGLCVQWSHMRQPQSVRGLQQQVTCTRIWMDRSSTIMLPVSHEIMSMCQSIYWLQSA